VKYNRGYDAANYLDIAFYPLRRAHYQKGLGEHYIASGRNEWNKQNYRSAYSLLLAGLARVPGDVQARRYVAITEARIGRMDRAAKTLSDGVKYAREDLDYLKLLFSVLLEGQQDDRVIELAQELLPARPDHVLVHQFIALQAATAHYHRGRTGEAERLVSAWGLQRSVEGQILLARCDSQHGAGGVAVARLERALTLLGQRDEIYVELVRLNRELGRHDEARRYALLRQFRNPDTAGPRIDLLHTYHTSGDTAAGQRELEAYLKAFSADANALVILAWFAVDTAQPALADQVIALARTQKFVLPAFNLAHVQAHLAAKDYARALELADAALRRAENPSDYSATLLGALRSVALFGIGDPARGQVMLSAFLENSRVRANDALLLSRLFRTLGQTTQARRILERACEIDRHNEPALAELIRLEADEGDRAALAENIPKLFAMRKHFRAALEETLRSLNEPSDAPLRQQIEAALAQPASP
jgi:tetratricopeptide (TPR) repeat protein